jgi:carbonic anhydrase
VKRLYQNNRLWAKNKVLEDPDFFSSLVKIQNPRYLWIGCSDSRVPANEIVGLQPGELFVHRNVANLVVHTDINCLSVIQYSVEVLKVKHIIVCGHYGCGGVKTVLEQKNLGLIDNWLRHIKDVYAEHHRQINVHHSKTDKLNKLCELNVKAQVLNVCHTDIVQRAWARKQKLSVHGLIYDLNDGLLKDLNVSFSSVKQIQKEYQVK